jgi:hypothetical protein
MPGVALSIMKNIDAISLRIAAILSVASENLHTPYVSMSFRVGRISGTQVTYRQAVDQADYAGTWLSASIPYWTVREDFAVAGFKLSFVLWNNFIGSVEIGTSRR